MLNYTDNSLTWHCLEATTKGRRYLAFPFFPLSKTISRDLLRLFRTYSYYILYPFSICPFITCSYYVRVAWDVRIHTAQTRANIALTPVPGRIHKRTAADRSILYPGFNGLTLSCTPDKPIDSVSQLLPRGRRHNTLQVGRAYKQVQFKSRAIFRIYYHGCCSYRDII